MPHSNWARLMHWRSHSTALLSSHFLWGMVGGLLVLRCVLAALVPLAPDEAYYWVWSRHLQWGYMDHPFMVAAWIRAGTYIFGNTAFGVRFCGLVSFFLANIAFFFTARRFFPSQPSAGQKALFLLNATLMAGIGLVPMTPDVPLFFFLTLALWALAHALGGEGQRKHNELMWWGVTGLCLGAAVESKYTAFLFVIGLAGFVVMDPRRLWERYGPWCSALGACVVAMPMVLWNAEHHWAGLLKQGGRVTMWHPARAGQFLGELCGGQAVLLTPWIAGLCLMGLWRGRYRGGALFLWLCAPAAIVFVTHALGDRVQANWVWVLYPALLLAGVGYGRHVRGAALSGLVCVCLVALQVMTGMIPLPAHFNPVARLTAGWGGMVQQLALQAQRAGVSAIITDDYALASILYFHHPQGMEIVSLDRRWSFVEGIESRFVRDGYHIRDAHYGPVDAGQLVVQRYDHGYTVRVYKLELRHNVQAWVVK